MATWSLTPSRWSAIAERSKWIPEQWPLIGVLVALVLTFTAIQPLFATPGNAQNLARQAAVLIIVACGQAIVVIGGGIDISVAAQVSVYSVVAAVASENWGIAPGLLTTLAVALIIGLANGLMATIGKISPIIATLVTAQVLTGGVLWYTSGLPAKVTDPAFRWFGGGHIGPIATPTVIALLMAVLAWVALNRVTTGRYVYAVGGNVEAARLSGIRVTAVTTASYVACSGFAAIAAVVLASRVGSGLADLGSGLEMASIAAVFIGGVAWGGGAGRIGGVVLGVLLLATLSNGLDLAAVSSDVQTVITGLLMAAAVALNSRRRARRGI